MRASQQLGYRRVSSKGQNLNRQLAHIEHELDFCFDEKVTGSSRERPELLRMIDHCKAGDTVHFHEIERFGRDVAYMIDTLRGLTEKGVTVKFHHPVMTFEGGKDNSINQFMFTIMAAMGELFLAENKKKQKEGIQARKDKGLQVGGQYKHNEETRRIIVEQCRLPLANISQIARDNDIGRATLHRWLKEFQV